LKQGLDGGEDRYMKLVSRVLRKEFWQLNWTIVMMTYATEMEIK
jgi:hypothetical protein